MQHQKQWKKTQLFFHTHLSTWQTKVTFWKKKKKRKSLDRREQRRKFSGFWPCAAPGTYDREQKKEKKKEIKKRSRMMRSDLGWSIPSPCCCGCGGVEGSVEWKYRLERGLYKGKQQRFLRGERWWWEWGGVYCGRRWETGAAEICRGEEKGGCAAGEGGGGDFGGPHLAVSLAGDHVCLHEHTTSTCAMVGVGVSWAGDREWSREP